MSKSARHERKRAARKRGRRVAPQPTPSPDALRASYPKLSATLGAFAEPVLDLLPDECSAEEYEMALYIALAIWNAEVEGDYGEWSRLVPLMIDDLANHTGVLPGAIKAEVEKLPARRRKLFKNDRRLFARVAVEDQGDRFNVVAMGTYPRPAPDGKGSAPAS